MALLLLKNKHWPKKTLHKTFQLTSTPLPSMSTEPEWSGSQNAMNVKMASFSVALGLKHYNNLLHYNYSWTKSKYFIILWGWHVLKHWPHRIACHFLLCPMWMFLNSKQVIWNRSVWEIGLFHFHIKKYILPHSRLWKKCFTPWRFLLLLLFCHS